MKTILFIALLAVCTSSIAQVYRDRIGFDLESIADIDIGWIKTYKYSRPTAGKQLGDRTYSAKQLGYCQQLVEWMQQSYLPKGCLGDAVMTLNYIPKFSGNLSRLNNAVNTHKAALPLLYGAYSKIYMYLKKDAAGKFIPQNNLADYWHIEANQLEYISQPVSFISSPDEYYFVLPDFASHPKGYDAEDQRSANLMGFRNQKNFAAYRHFYIPPKIINDYPYYVVIMTRNNELPFEKVTIGTFFTEAEKQFPYWQKTDPIPAAAYATAQKQLARLKEKYRSRWNDIATLELSNTQIDLYDFVNANEDRNDMFDNKDMYGKEGQGTRFPIMKVARAARERSKTDQPEWLVIRWSAGMENQPYFIHLHESIMNNFNFEYAYNFFFNPEKLKGASYKPLRSPSNKEVVPVLAASENSKMNIANKNIVFFEDFSTIPEGKKPTGWYTGLANSGTTAIVTQPEDLDGNWLMLRGHTVRATLIKTPLPQNFTLSYDVIAAKDFTWGAKGLTMQLSKEITPGNAESFLKLRLRPGFDGRDGEATLETKFPAPPGYANETKWYKAKGFSNNKKYNRIAVTIKKAGEQLQVFIDGNKIAEYQKAIPAAHLFNALSFDCSGNREVNDTYYLSNIRIEKE